MRHQKNHLIVGIFVISGLFLIAGAITVLGAKDAFAWGEPMESYFEDPITGLDKGSPVRFRGVRVGEVTEISTTGLVYQITGRENNYALVRVRVYPGLLGISPDDDFNTVIAARIADGLRVKLVPSILGGTAHLEAVFDPTADNKLAFAWQPDSIYVPATSSTLKTFAVSIETALDKLNEADIVGFIEVAKGTLGRLDQALLDADVAGLSSKAQETLNTLQAEITQLGDKLGTTLQNAERAMARADVLLSKPELERAITRLDRLATNADAAMVDFRKLVNRSNQTVVEVQNAVHGRGRDIAAITDGLRELVDNLNSLSGMLERHPSLFVFGTAPKAAPKSAEAPAASNASVPTKQQK